jgi:O-antigen/teichoic acid export membrane protein
MLFRKKEVLPLYKFGVSIWMTNIASLIFNSVDRIIVTGLLGPANGGVYSAMTSVTSKINELSAVPIRVITPVISAAITTNLFERIRRIFTLSTIVNNTVVFLVAVPIMLLATPICHYLFGGNFKEENSAVFRILVFVYSIYSLGAAGFFTAIGIGKPGLNAFYGISAGFLVIIGIALLTPRWGLYGAAWANLMYSLILVVAFKIAIEIRIGLKEYSKKLFPIIVGLSFWFVTCQIISNMKIQITEWYVISFSLFYLIIMIFLFIGTENFKKSITYLLKSNINIV